MKLYCGIDLHSNNSVLSVLDESDRPIFEKRLPNELECIRSALSPYRSRLEGVVVESTFNWYWLVDGLQAEGYRLHLANTAAMKQYEGLKFTDDAHDARWLAHMLRLGILPRGYIYPKEERAVRDLLRKRMQMVRQRSTQILSIQNLVIRNTGKRLNGTAIKKLSEAELAQILTVPEQALSAMCNLAVMRSLDLQTAQLEQAIKARMKARPQWKLVTSVAGVGDVLGWTILLESGDIRRFASAGNYASYCRCVESRRESNGKKKGENNRKNGNKYLSWAFVEAANFAIRYHDLVKRFYQRKRDKRNGVVAIKAVAHKLSRATYHVLKNGEPFDVTRAFC